MKPLGEERREYPGHDSALKQRDSRFMLTHEVADSACTGCGCRVLDRGACKECHQQPQVDTRPVYVVARNARVFSIWKHEHPRHTWRYVTSACDLQGARGRVLHLHGWDGRDRWWEIAGEIERGVSSGSLTLVDADEFYKDGPQGHSVE